MTNQDESVSKPALELLESYILDTIGELPDSVRDKSSRVVRRVLGRGEWRQVLREQFGLEVSVDDQLRAMWQESRAAAAELGRTLSPGDFARLVVEENFNDLVEMMSAEIEAADAKSRG